MIVLLQDLGELISFLITTQMLIKVNLRKCLFLWALTVKFYFTQYSDETNLLKCQILSNANILKEYENWINLILNVINTTQKENEYFDLATPVEKNIEKMDSLAKDNFEINKKIIKEKKK